MKYILKSIFRNFTRKPVINLINLLGLAISLTLVIILSVYCYSELTTDNFHKNGDRVYYYGELDKSLYTPAILKETIDQGVPGVETTVRIAGPWETPVFQFGNNDPVTSDILFADPDFFKLFTYRVVDGSLETALNDPLTIVITDRLAKKVFGKEQVAGKMIRYNNEKEFIIKAVIESPNANSCLSFNAVTSIATRKIVQPNGGELTEWGYCNFQTFILLKKGSDPNEIAKRISAVVPEKETKDYAKKTLVPFKQLYFSKFKLYDGNYLHCGDKTKVMILLMIALLVLVVALINFVNISASQWIEKIRQTGVMKVIGAKRSMIVRQILSESFFLFVAALIICLLLTRITVPIIQTITGINFNQQLMYSPSYIVIYTVAVFLLSITFSILPALKISSSKTVYNLKRTLNPGGQKSITKGLLVTLQFVIAIALIAFTILVQKQVNFGSDTLPMNKENIVGVRMTPQLTQKKGVLKKILGEQPGILDFSFGQYYPGKPLSHWGTQMELNNEKKRADFDMFDADAEFFKMMRLQLTAGRFYNNDVTGDNGNIIVNESFVKAHNLDDPIGWKINGGPGQSMEIIGVVKDFHYKSVTQPVIPLVIRNDNDASYCLISFGATNFTSLNKSLKRLKTDLSKLSPSFPVEVSFLDVAVENMYQSELQFQRIFSLFAISAIVICCLGILAISMFTCQQRVKEIGVRKVNGARVTEILAMLNQDFIKWVAIAFIIACPIAYYAMHQWLQNFAYKTELSWWVFAAAGAVAVAVALLTVSWQSWRAATRNPVESLRYE
jgi:putative ABC transport system permease protein